MIILPVTGHFIDVFYIYILPYGSTFINIENAMVKET